MRSAGARRLPPSSRVGAVRQPNRQFKEGSADFRNSYNHGFSARLVLGITGSVTRIVGADGGVSYGFGGDEPLDLAAAADLLENERAKCHADFEAFQTLV